MFTDWEFDRLLIFATLKSPTADGDAFNAVRLDLAGPVPKVFAALLSILSVAVALVSLKDALA